MLENPFPTIFTTHYVVVSHHITRFAETAAPRASFSSEAVPLPASALYLNVEIGTRFPLKDQIHAIYIQIVLVTHSFK